MEVVEAVQAFVLTVNTRYAWVPVLDVGKAIAVAVLFRRVAEKQSWAQQLVALILCCLGGTTLTGVLLGQPPSWVCGANTFPTYILGYLAVNFAPGDVVWRVAQFAIVAELLILIDAVSWGTAITSWGVDKAIAADHAMVARSPWAAILAGCLSGTGGGIINEALSLTHSEWVFATPPSLAVPSYGIRVALTAAPTYYLLHNPHNFAILPTLLSRDDAKFLVIIGVAAAALAKQWVWGQIAEDVVEDAADNAKTKAE